MHQRLGMPARYYDFIVHGWRFIALDGNDQPPRLPQGQRGIRRGGKVPRTTRSVAHLERAIGPDQLAWLRGVLDDVTARGNLPCSWRIFRVSGDPHNLWNAGELLALIDEYPCVKAYINGHNHKAPTPIRKGPLRDLQGHGGHRREFLRDGDGHPGGTQDHGLWPRRGPRATHPQTSFLNPVPKLMSLVPPLWSNVHKSTPGQDNQLPIADTPFMEHVRKDIAPDTSQGFPGPQPPAQIEAIAPPITTPAIKQGALTWVGAEDGLFHSQDGESYTRHACYGVDGPLSNRIAGLAADSRGALWVATPAGLSSRDAEGNWSSFRGREGLPWEELTCIAIDASDRIWLGSTRGLIQYRPYEEGRHGITARASATCRTTM